MGVKSFGREAQGATPKMRKPPLKARAYTVENIALARRNPANPSQKSENSISSTSPTQASGAGDSLSSSVTPYDPAMSTYCSTSDAQKHTSLSIHDVSVLGDTSMHSGFSREHSIKTSSMSELYPVSEHLDLQERLPNTRGTPPAISSSADQHTVVTYRIHSNYMSTGTTFAMRVVSPHTGTDMGNGVVNRTQDSSLMSMNGPEPAENLSFTGMEPRASYSHAQRVPTCVDENDNVALSDSVQEMMAAMAGTAHQDRSININQELSGKDHTLSGIKSSVVYNSQAHNAKSSDNMNTPGDTAEMQRTSQVSNDASINFTSSHLTLSFKNQADNSQSSGQRYESAEDRNGFLVPSVIPKASAFMATDKRAASELTAPSHTKEHTVMSTRTKCNTESRQLLSKPDEKDSNTPTFSLSSIKGLPLNNVCVAGGDRGLSSMRSIRQSITNTYDYHDYTATDDFRSDPVFSDLTTTRSTLVQFGNYTTTSQNTSDCGVHGDCKDLACTHNLNPIFVMEDGVELGLSEIGVPPESVQLMEKQHSSPNSASMTTEHHTQQSSNSPTDNLANNGTPLLEAQTQKQEKCISISAATDTSKVIHDTFQSTTPQSASQKEIPKQSSLYKLDLLEQPSAELMRQFQQFQLFQQFQQLQRMQCHQDVPGTYRYVPQTATLTMQPPATGVQASNMYIAGSRAVASDAPCTPITNPKTGPGRPSSARSPYPGIDSRIGGASPFDKTAKSVSQTLLKPNLDITESAIDIVNDVVNALDGQGALEDAPDTQLNLHITNLPTGIIEKEATGPGVRGDTEPSDSFLTERLRSLSRLTGYRVTGKDEFILQQTIPKNVADTSIYRYMTNTQKSRFAELKEGSSTKMLQLESNDIVIKTYEDSCAFIEDIRQEIHELHELSQDKIMRLVKQVMLGAIQQHKLLTNYKITITKLQDEQAIPNQQKTADTLECQSPTRNLDSDPQVQTLKANLRKALARNATLVAKLEEYAERIKEYKRQEKQLARAEKEQIQDGALNEQLSYIKASPRRA
ncbi:Spindle pole protein, putative [Giardia lamblia P15]|uniref:Spindle pole protein, putative n=1 Tax=Giardia intestinalis (strain P15) TaxID=658858 RepID=E1F4U3_GIAIA|nr:Spindle pole protein, putative [Giardia lamblia P15]